MYYKIKDGCILTAETQYALSRFYDDVKMLPFDYEEGKYIVVDNELVLNPNWEEEKAQKERQRLNSLSLTKREVFLALYKAKGLTPEMVRNTITDSAALIEFDYATEYYRGNPLINVIGQQLGYSPEDLDYLFENGQLPCDEEIAYDSERGTDESRGE